MIKYSAFNTEVFSATPLTAKSILDIGCGTGELGKALKEQAPERIVYGITYSEEEKIEATSKIDTVIMADLNSFNFNDLEKKFDVVIASHVLEHLYQPWEVVANMQLKLDIKGKLIIAIPNLLYYKYRLQILKGKFKYSLNGGIMDITHFRFFDWQSSEMLADLSPNLILEKKIAVGNFPLGIFRKSFPFLAKKIDQFCLSRYPGLFGSQFVLIYQKQG
ncbi:MAG: cyclopropane fatty acyl phospholipid synthase [Mucilaginibacter sp.]|nr:cyclopropane fatty acyl phospholipid synthase [Mucilaginibacter sp.]